MKFKSFNPLICFKSTQDEQYYIIVDGVWHPVERYYDIPELLEMHEKISYGTQDIVKSPVKSYTVEGSKGSIYEVTVMNGIWNCTCPAHSFRRRSDCKHITQIKTTLKQ